MIRVDLVMVYGNSHQYRDFYSEVVNCDNIDKFISDENIIAIKEKMLMEYEGGLIVNVSFKLVDKEGRTI